MRWSVAGARGGLAPASRSASSETNAIRSTVVHLERIELVALEELAELLQIGAVGLERVARQPALELEVAEEVERQLGDPAEAPATACVVAMPRVFAAAGGGSCPRSAVPARRVVHVRLGGVAEPQRLGPPAASARTRPRTLLDRSRSIRQRGDEARSS